VPLDRRGFYIFLVNTDEESPSGSSKQFFEFGQRYDLVAKAS
jgi:hypothetical protein